jgi:SAM-dependent methyltransferase
MMHRIKEFVDACAYPFYVLRGRRPWTAGYYTARRCLIERAIDARSLAPGVALPPGYGARLDERVVEYPWLYARLPREPGVVLDAGSALNHLFLLSRPPIVNSNLSICTLAPEKRCYWKRAVSYIFDDLRATRFGHGVFDIVISVSTIEHIGLDNTLLYTADASKREHDAGGFIEAVREFRRILKPGGSCFITVPFGKAKNHGWFQVFDSAMIDAILKTFKPTDSEISYFGYSAEGWAAADPESLKEATFFDIHAQKRYDPDFAAGGRGVACLRLTG